LVYFRNGNPLLYDGNNGTFRLFFPWKDCDYIRKREVNVFSNSVKWKEVKEAIDSLSRTRNAWPSRFELANFLIIQPKTTEIVLLNVNTVHVPRGKASDGVVIQTIGRHRSLMWCDWHRIILTPMILNCFRIGPSLKLTDISPLCYSSTTYPRPTTISPVVDLRRRIATR
jgi:hypothetical protein